MERLYNIDKYKCNYDSKAISKGIGIIYKGDRIPANDNYSELLRTYRL